MARKRMLDPTLWDDPDLAQLTPIERLLFIALVSLADDYGHIAAHPALLRKWAFGYDDVTTAEVKTMRDHIIIRCRNVLLYSVGGQEYIWLKTWERHQDLRFRAKALYPCHACGQYHEQGNFKVCPGREAQAQDTTPPLHISTEDMTHYLPPDYVTSCHVEDTLCSDKLHDQAAPNGAKQTPRRSKKTEPQENHAEDFAQFWDAYPLKIGKPKALKLYRDAIKHGVPPETILTAATNYAAECKMASRTKDYIAHPKTFLGEERWENYQEPPDPADFQPRAHARASPPSTAHERTLAAIDRVFGGDDD